MPLLSDFQFPNKWTIWHNHLFYWCINNNNLHQVNFDIFHKVCAVVHTYIKETFAVLSLRMLAISTGSSYVQEQKNAAINGSIRWAWVSAVASSFVEQVLCISRYQHLLTYIVISLIIISISMQLQLQNLWCLQHVYSMKLGFGRAPQVCNVSEWISVTKNERDADSCNKSQLNSKQDFC